MRNIILKDINVRYSKLTKYTISDININIKSNTKNLIVGPSGCGKSTLCMVLNGLLNSDNKAHIVGEYLLDDKVLNGLSIHKMSEYISTILQDQDAQFIGLTVAEDIAFSDENNCIKRNLMHDRVDGALNNLDISYLKEYEPSDLSGGEKQRVSLAGLLNTKAEILLFDEPLANLDPEGAKQVLQLIDKLQEAGKTIIMIEHRLEEVLPYNYDQIIVMNEGVIKYQGDIDTCLKSDVLSINGLRKPLFLEFMDKLSIDYQNESNLHDPKYLSKNLVNKELLIKAVGNKLDNDSNVLSLNNVSFSYGQNQVLKNVSLDVKQGNITALIGNNGSGKSTLFKLIMGINPLVDGRILLNDNDISKMGIYVRGQSIGYVMQNPNHMITRNTVDEEVSYSLVLSGMKKSEIDILVDDVLKRCNLLKYKKWPIEMLSYGQKRRVTIASVLVTKPKVLLLDEPTAGQDYETYKEFMKLIIELKNEDMAILLVTHNMQLVVEYCDIVCILDHGQVAVVDATSQVISIFDKYKSANLSKTSLSEFSSYQNLDEIDVIETFRQRGV